LHSHAGYLSLADGDGQRSHGRDSADQWTPRSASLAADLRLRDRRRSPRYRQQAGIFEGACLLRAASARSRRTFPQIPRGRVQPFASFAVDGAADVSLFAASLFDGLAVVVVSGFAVSPFAGAPAELSDLPFCA